jgi:hypothetical protein
MSRTEKLQFHESYPEIQAKIQYLMKTFGFRCMKEVSLVFFFHQSRLEKLEGSRRNASEK